jgi:hypothetical protein
VGKKSSQPCKIYCINITGRQTIGVGAAMFATNVLSLNQLIYRSRLVRRDAAGIRGSASPRTIV